MKKRNEQEAYQLLTSRQLLALYRSYSRAGELKYASPVFEYLLESTYSDAEGYFEKAVVLKEILRTEEALEACDKAIELKPDFAAAYALKAKIILHKMRKPCKRIRKQLSQVPKTIFIIFLPLKY
ncbi:tetratricopeptide repeat protein [Rickettsia rhipicephali]|nr:tetratricopeptide repeat protein [Rickettsia rhipicephali]